MSEYIDTELFYEMEASDTEKVVGKVNKKTGDFEIKPRLLTSLLRKNFQKKVKDKYGCTFVNDKGTVDFDKF